MGKRVLLVSHNALGKENNMARTLENQFKGFESSHIAQLFFSDEEPDSDYCNNYFQISDSDVFRSIFFREEVGCKVTNQKYINKKDVWIKKNIREKGKKRSLIYITRNLIWRLGKWKSQKLDDWLDDFNPDIVYFASGDYSFSYMVTLYIAKKRNIPIIIGCYDDYYINRIKTINPLYNLVYNDLIKNAKELFNHSSAFTAVSDVMSDEYCELFNKKGYTLYTPSSLLNVDRDKDRVESVVYVGNIGLGRAEQLITIGRALNNIGVKGLNHIDVYSSQVRNDLIDKLNAEKGINFCGRVSADKAQELISTSKYVIHTESFNDDFKRRVKYSLSTKIADCLSSGACIISFGSPEVASISYLSDNNAAYVITNEQSLEKKLLFLFESNDIREKICESAKNLALKNHKEDKTTDYIRQIVDSVFDY